VIVAGRRRAGTEGVEALCFRPSSAEVQDRVSAAGRHAELNDASAACSSIHGLLPNIFPAVIASHAGTSHGSSASGGISGGEIRSGSAEGWCHEENTATMADQATTGRISKGVPQLAAPTANHGHKAGPLEKSSRRPCVVHDSCAAGGADDRVHRPPAGRKAASKPGRRPRRARS